MDLTIALKDLRPAITAAKKLTRRNYGAAGGNGVTIDASAGVLHITSTDHEITLTSRVPATVRAGGSVTVDAAALAAVLKGKGSVILSDAREGFLRVENGVSTDLPTQDAYVLPTGEWDDQSHRVELATVGQVAAAASGDDARPILAGVYFDGAHIVATDSYRLHLAEIAGRTFPRVLVPARAFGFLPKSGTAYLTAGKTSRPGVPYAVVDADGNRAVRPVTISEGHVMVKCDAATVIVRTVDGEFPNYRQLIPAGPPHAVSFERETFLKVLAGVGATLARTARPVRLRIDGSELVVFAHGEDGSEASSGRVPCKGDDLAMFPAVAFNPGFLADAVSTLTGEYATLQLTDSLKPALLRETGAGVESVRLVMPVRT